MPRKTVYEMKLAHVYPQIVLKAEKKGRTKEEVDTLTKWLTGYTQEQLDAALADPETSYAGFFRDAPAVNPNAHLIKGVICGYRVEEIEDPVQQRLRQLDKMVDELAKGKAMEKILRS